MRGGRVRQKKRTCTSELPKIEVASKFGYRANIKKKKINKKLYSHTPCLKINSFLHHNFLERDKVIFEQETNFDIWSYAVKKDRLFSEERLVSNQASSGWFHFISLSSLTEGVLISEITCWSVWVRTPACTQQPMTESYNIHSFSVWSDSGFNSSKCILIVT